MKNFQLVTKGVNVFPLAHALMRQPELWNADRFRTTFPGTPHVDVADILIRYSDTEKCSTRTQVMGDRTNIWYPALQKLPQVKTIAKDLMHLIDGYELGRVLITKIPPGGQILPHADNQGEYVLTERVNRYHVVVQGLPGSLFNCGDETVNMQTGEIWWFDAHQVHSVVNNSRDDRIHLLLDYILWP